MVLLDERLTLVDELDHGGEVGRKYLLNERIDLRLLELPETGALLRFGRDLLLNQHGHNVVKRAACPKFASKYPRGFFGEKSWKLIPFLTSSSTFPAGTFEVIIPLVNLPPSQRPRSKSSFLSMKLNERTLLRGSSSF